MVTSLSAETVSSGVVGDHFTNMAIQDGLRSGPGLHDVGNKSGTELPNQALDQWKQVNYKLRFKR